MPTAATASQSHLSPRSVDNTRPRARSFNANHTQPRFLQGQVHNSDQDEDKDDIPVTPPSTTALDQIMSNLTQQQQHGLGHGRGHGGPSSSNANGNVNGIVDSNSSHSHFPLQPSPMPAGSEASSPKHSREKSQTTVVGSTFSTSTLLSDPSSQLHHSDNQLPIDAVSTKSHSHSSNQQQNHRHQQHSHHQNGQHNSSTTENVNNSSSNAFVGSNHSPVQLHHRPHTPFKASFPLSISSDHPSDSVTIHSSPSSPSKNVHLGSGGNTRGGGGRSGGIADGGGGDRGGGDGRASSSMPTAAGAAGTSSVETISTTKSSLFRSLSTKSGRKELMKNEKHLGSLPTIHHHAGRRHDGAVFLGVSMKHLSLLVLLLQNSVLVLMMRYSRVSVDPDQPMYLASTAVFLAEIIKLCTCIVILVYKTQSLLQAIYIIRTEIIEQPHEILKMLVPSGLYALQNNLLYIALSNLEAATFQVTYQMKILSTAIFSVMMLNKRLTRQKWLSLCLLMVGVTLVQLQNVGSPKSPVVDLSDNDEGDGEFLDPYMADDMAIEADSATTSHLADMEEESVSGQNPIIGLFAVLTSCVSSGFAGCYFEKILKGSEADMWVRNLQLGISGSLFSFLAMFYDRQKIYEGGMFQGYSTITWVVITNQALGGLLVAIVVKYADNILKGFATSLSIIISGMISVYFFDFEPSFQFQLGTLVVILATFMYGRPDAPIPRFIRPQKKRQSMPPPVKY